MRTTYTWSHAIDTLSDTFSSSVNQINLGWLDPADPQHKLDKGDAYYDLRQRFTLGATWDIPYRRASRWGKQVAGGWTLAPIFQAYTGPPFSLYDCTNATTQCPYAFARIAVPIKGTGPLVPTATPNNYQNMSNVSRYFDSSWYNPKMGASDFGPFPSNM